MAGNITPIVGEEVVFKNTHKGVSCADCTLARAVYCISGCHGSSLVHRTAVEEEIRVCTAGGAAYHPVPALIFKRKTRCMPGWTPDAEGCMNYDHIAFVIWHENYM